MMELPELPAEVETLLRERVESYEELHLLLLLFNERRDWSAEAAASQLKLPPQPTTAGLEALARHGLARRAEVATDSPQPSYHYASGVHDDAAAALAEAHRNYPLAVIRSMASLSIDRIRAGAIKAFADAFLFRKGK
jgi:predicted ArsR family transcriptional regulator